MLTDDAKKAGIHPTQDRRKVNLDKMIGAHKLSLADALGIEEPEKIANLDQAIKEKLKTEYRPPKG